MSTSPYFVLGFDLYLMHFPYFICTRCWVTNLKNHIKLEIPTNFSIGVPLMGFSAKGERSKEEEKAHEYHTDSASPIEGKQKEWG